MDDITREQIELIAAGSSGSSADLTISCFVVHALSVLALEALAKREGNTIVRKVWRNEYEDRNDDFDNERFASDFAMKAAIRKCVPITITETEGH